MKPFAISCTTCGARLKVRDERAIGELSLCPKCGSMVMITPPSPGGEQAAPSRQSAPSGSSAQLVIGGSASSDFDDAAALLADTIEDMPQPAAQKPATQQPAAERAPTATPKNGSPAGVTSPQPNGKSKANAQAKTNSPTKAKSQPQPKQQPEAKPSSEAKARPASPTSEASPQVNGRRAAAAPESKSPQSKARTPTPPAIEPPTESMSSIELDSLSNAECGVRNAEWDSGSTDMASRRLLSGSESLSGAPADSALRTPHSALPSPPWRRYGLIAVAVLAAVGFVGGVLTLVWPKSKPAQAVANAEENSPPANVEKQTPPNTTETNTPPDHKGTTKVSDGERDDDLEIDKTVPPVVDEGEKDKDDGDPPIAKENGPGAEAPPIFTPEDGDPPKEGTGDEVAKADTGLGDLVPFIEGIPTPDPPPVDGPADGEPDSVADGPVVRERPEIKNVDVKARLADKISGIDAGGAPLAKFVELITQISTIPITLDPAALAQAKARPDSPVTLTLTDATVAKILSAALAAHRLGYEVRGEQVVVTAAPRTREPMLTANYEVDDLAADEAAMRQLIEDVRTFVEPSTWHAQGGEGTLRAEGGKLAAGNTQDVHFALHVFLQKLRVARGLKPRSSFDPAMFALTTRTAKAQKKLDTRVRAVFHAERPLTQILGHLEKAAEVNLLVDWQSLQEAGWPTSSTATLVADEVPLSVALEKLLAPMELTYRAIDASTIQIVSQQALKTQPELEIYSLEEALTGGATPAQFIADLQTKLGPERFAEHGGPFAIRYDEPSKCLLVLVPQEQQREVERSASHQPD